MSPPADLPSIVYEFCPVELIVCSLLIRGSGVIASTSAAVFPLPSHLLLAMTVLAVRYFVSIGTTITYGRRRSPCIRGMSSIDSLDLEPVSGSFPLYSIFMVPSL